MAFDPMDANIKKALDLDKPKTQLPTGVLPSRAEKTTVTCSYNLEPVNKEKLARMAKQRGYGKSTSAFLNDWIASIEE